MKNWKKLTVLGLVLVMCLSLTACGGEMAEKTVETPVEDDTTVRVTALKGPTGMGVAYLEELGEGQYDLSISAKPDEVMPLLLKGTLDVACVPANVAAILYNKSQGQIVTMGINTLGVLYVVEQGNSIQSIQDLKGKTIVSGGKGMTPEYSLRYLLQENGLDPERDVTIQWKSEQSECLAALASGAASIAMLPEPFVTVAQEKLEGLRVALDLTKEWSALENGSEMVTGVVVAQKPFAQEHPKLMEELMEDYARSVEKVHADPTAAAERIGEMGIVEASIAEKALPSCNTVCISGSQMKSTLSGYLQVLYDASPEAVGGQLPGEDFYFGA